MEEVEEIETIFVAFNGEKSEYIIWKRLRGGG